MGTSGNRKGNKLFSISTTIRNPFRNLDFILSLHELIIEKQLVSNNGYYYFSINLLNEYYLKLIQKGIYKPMNIEESIKLKLKDSILLTKEEALKIVKNNPQATDLKGGGANRVKTHLRALKDQNLIKLVKNKNGTVNINLTKIALELVEGTKPIDDIYLKAFINLQFGGIIRRSALNKAMPFLNLLFTLYHFSKEHEQKISKEEFMIFILSMKDCDYINSISKINKFRNLKDKKDKQLFKLTHLKILELVKLKENSWIRDYVDEVYRKFSITNLFSINNYGYIGLNLNNIKKINYLIHEFKNYNFVEYKSYEEYYKNIEKYELPWEKDSSKNIEIIISKSEKYNIIFSKNADIQEKQKQIYLHENKSKFEIIAKEININYVIENIISLVGSEYKIITKSNISNFDYNYVKDIKKFILLEWFISILLFKKVNDAQVYPGGNFDEFGYPSCQALGGKADILFKSEKIIGTFEVTLIKDSKQQLNSETTSITNHITSIKMNDKKFFSLLLAPKLHPNPIEYFDFASKKNNLIITGSTIINFLNFIIKKDELNSFEIYSFVLQIYEKFKDKEFLEIKLILDKLNSEKIINFK